MLGNMKILSTNTNKQSKLLSLIGSFAICKNKNAYTNFTIDFLQLMNMSSYLHHQLEIYVTISTSNPLNWTFIKLHGNSNKKIID